jgi:enterochelin esterase-like enzyme
MRQTLVLPLIALALTVGAPSPAAAAGTDGAGNVVMTTLPAPSMHEVARSVRVYLPPTYDRPEAAKRRYPVVYLLHGWPGGDGNWVGHGRAAQTLDSLSGRGAIPEMIAVMPNGNGIGLLGRQGWLNSYDGRANLEDFVWKDLVRWTDQHYRTIPDSAHRALIGLSEGASAALNIAFSHPGVFMACGGLSGEYVLGKDVGMKAVWGDEPAAARIREENSPTLYAAKIVPTLRQQVIYFDCGASDGEREDNRRLDRTLTQLGVPHVYQEFPGSHGWGFWKIHLRDALLACTPQMK